MSDNMIIVLDEIRKLNKRFDSVENGLHTVKDQVGHVTEDLRTVKDQVDHVTEDLRIVKDQVNHVTEDLHTVKDQVNHVTEDLRIVKDQTARNNEYQTTLESTINEKILVMETDIKVLKMAVSR